MSMRVICGVAILLSASAAQALTPATIPSKSSCQVPAANLALLQKGQSEAVKVDFDTAVALALHNDPRVAEREHLVRAAQGLVQEAEGADDWIIDVTTAVALTTNVEGGFFRAGTTSASNNDVRDDLYDTGEGFGPFFSLQAAIIKPLYTFGKIENYKKAAEGKVAVEKGEVAIQCGKTTLDVAKAYYGYLASRDGRYLLEDAQKRLAVSKEAAQKSLEEGKNGVKKSDLYAIDAGLALVNKFHAQAQGFENIAHEGLALITGIPRQYVQPADSRLRPIEMPTQSLAELQAQALRDRPEMKQLQAGLAARRALVEAKRAEARPNVFAGVVGSAAYSPQRDSLDNPHIIDPFNHYAGSPVLGLQWKWETGRNAAQIVQATAELDALVSKGALANSGIPFQVAEAYHQAVALQNAYQELLQGSKAARLWMLSSYLDFEAGLEEPAKILEALKTYVLSYSDYLVTVNDYNTQVMALRHAIGELQ